MCIHNRLLLLLVGKSKVVISLSFFFFSFESLFQHSRRNKEKKESELLHVCLGVGVEVLAHHPSRQPHQRAPDVDLYKVDDATFFFFFFPPFHTEINAQVGPFIIHHVNFFFFSCHDGKATLNWLENGARTVYIL